MAFAGTYATTSATAVAGSTIVDPQIFLALVRHACRQIPNTVRFYLDNTPIKRPIGSDVWARLVAMDLPAAGDGHVGGSDQRACSFVMRVFSDGVNDGQRTNDNRLGGVAAQIIAALTGRSFTYTPKTTPPESEPEGVHVLMVGDVGLQTEVDEAFTPAGSLMLTAQCTIVRDTGRGMLTIPT